MSDRMLACTPPAWIAWAIDPRIERRPIRAAFVVGMGRVWMLEVRACGRA